MFVGVIIVIIDRTSAGRIKRRARQEMENEEKEKKE